MTESVGIVIERSRSKNLEETQARVYNEATFTSGPS
jgi:hypothetical protein